MKRATKAVNSSLCVTQAGGGLGNLFYDRPVREAGVADNVTIVIKRTEEELGCGGARLDERKLSAQLRRRNLVVDGCLAPLKHQLSATTAFDPKDRFDRQLSHFRCRQRDKIETRRALKIRK